MQKHRFRCDVRQPIRNRHTVKSLDRSAIGVYEGCLSLLFLRAHLRYYEGLSVHHGSDMTNCQGCRENNCRVLTEFSDSPQSSLAVIGTQSQLQGQINDVAEHLPIELDASIWDGLWLQGLVNNDVDFSVTKVDAYSRNVALRTKGHSLEQQACIVLDNTDSTAHKLP